MLMTIGIGLIMHKMIVVSSANTLTASPVFHDDVQVFPTKS